MAKQTVNRLLGLEIDEVSLVDRPANQHGLVTITKRDEDSMATGLYDADGVEYQDDELEAGMQVLDADGNLRLLLTEDDAAELEAEGYDLENLQIPDDASELEDELAPVGKGAPAWVTGGMSTIKQTGRGVKTKALGVRDEVMINPRVSRGRSHVSANAGKYGLATGAATGYEGGKMRGRMKKSMGQEVLEELSKAYTDSDRDRVIAKALGRIDESDQRARRAENIAKALEERAELVEFVELAKSYDLPVEDSALGAILQVIAKSGLSDAQLDTVDRIFAAAGEAIFVEKGYTGRSDSPIMEAIQGQAYDLVTKADVTPEQATVALLDANPDAYLEYLSEMKG